MKRYHHQYAPDGETHADKPEQIRPDEEFLPDLRNDEIAYQERGEIRRGILDEDDRSEDALANDSRTSDDETVTPGA